MYIFIDCLHHKSYVYIYILTYFIGMLISCSVGRCRSLEVDARFSQPYLSKKLPPKTMIPTLQGTNIYHIPPSEKENHLQNAMRIPHFFKLLLWGWTFLNILSDDMNINFKRNFTTFTTHKGFFWLIFFPPFRTTVELHSIRGPELFGFF